jgi:hypothetical protein
LTKATSADSKIRSMGVFKLFRVTGCFINKQIIGGQDFGYSRQCCRELTCCRMWCCVIGWVVPSVSNNHTAFILRVKQILKMKALIYFEISGTTHPVTSITSLKMSFPQIIVDTQYRQNSKLLSSRDFNSYFQSFMLSWNEMVYQSHW